MRALRAQRRLAEEVGGITVALNDTSHLEGVLFRKFAPCCRKIAHGYYRTMRMNVDSPASRRPRSCSICERKSGFRHLRHPQSLSDIWLLPDQPRIRARSLILRAAAIVAVLPTRSMS